MDYQILKPTNADGLLTSENRVLVGEHSEITMQPGKSMLVIGKKDNPLYTFYAAEMVSVTGENTVELAGNELSIDRINPIVHYTWLIRYVLKPEDTSGLITSDGKILCSMWNDNLAEIPYGTEIWFYDNDLLQGKYYVEYVERTGREQWAIHGISAVGLLDVQMHRGGVYTGKPFAELIQEFFGGEIGTSENGVTPITGGIADCYIEDDVAITTVHGLLPYDTKRNNLHQLIFAYVISLTKTETGDLIFSYLKPNPHPDEIPPERIYMSGNVRYEQPITDVELTEYTYVYDENAELEEVYDNVDSPHVQGEALVIFKTPIRPETIVTSEPNMIVRDANETSAYVTGNGIISAVPYIIQSRVLSRSVQNAVLRKTVTASNVTMINPLNSNNCLTRLFDYYTQCKIVNNSIVTDGEKAGQRYSFVNPYREWKDGFIRKMVWKKTSLLKADCEIVTDYEPTGVSTNMQNMVLLTGSGLWKVPTGVRESDSPFIRAVLIGGGQGGHGGYKGENSLRRADEPGLGGLGGEGGLGGRVLTVDIDVSNIANIAYNCGNGGKGGASDTEGQPGGDTTFGDYSTYFGAISPGGIMNLMNGKFYARSGGIGISGAAGGKGVMTEEEIELGTLIAKYGSDGESLTVDDRTWKGGKGGRGNGSSAGGYTGWAFGAGGGGAAYGANGKNGGSGNVYWGAVIGGFGGEGATATIPGDDAKNIGAGGEGGHGGGGGGAPGDSGWSGGTSPTGYVGKGGLGSDGGKGGDGGILIYY